MTMGKADDLLIVAGEASGDLHGARLLSALRDRVPTLRCYGMGGDELDAAGMERIADAAEISVVGITEILRILGRARAIFDDLLAAVDARGTRFAVLIDFPEFNLRLAKQLARRGVRVVYYISPQVWAWRKGRVKTIAKTIERMLVLFPFEVDFFRDHGVNAVHVGHPLVDEVPEVPQAWDRVASSTSPEPARVVLLPGSRSSEVRALLPTMLQAVAQLASDRPVTVRLIQAATVPATLFDALLAESEVAVERVRSDRYAAIADAHVAICASGTATLEVALLGTPMVMIYRVTPISYGLGRMLVRLPAVSLVNLVLEERVVPELLQGQARPDRIVSEVRTLLDDADARSTMRQGLARVRGALGARGGSQRAADEVAAVLASASPGEAA